MKKKCNLKFLPNNPFSVENTVKIITVNIKEEEIISKTKKKKSYQCDHMVAAIGESREMSGKKIGQGKKQTIHKKHKIINSFC